MTPSATYCFGTQCQYVQALIGWCSETCVNLCLKNSELVVALESCINLYQNMARINRISQSIG